MSVAVSHKRARVEESFNELALKLPKNKMRVLIYSDDDGPFQESVSALQAELTRLLGTQMKIKRVTAQYLTTKAWEQKTALLVMGSGECSRWDMQLQEAGILRIKNFVENGGRYLGICAGAYFAALESLFALSGADPKLKLRLMKFYKGRAYGPLIPTTDPRAPHAAMAAQVDMAGKRGFCYYQAGCAFDIAEDSAHTKVLARYSGSLNGAAIISCRVGQKGRAVLSGIHPEFLCEKKMAEGAFLPEYCSIVQILSAHEDFRQSIWKEIIEELFAARKT